MQELPGRAPGYLPLREYGVIGNEASVALVRIDGSIDWCCLPYLDSPSVFGALLDAKRGGYFLVRPVQRASRRSQRYLEETNVLLTEFEVEGAHLEVLDFMPLGEEFPRLEAPPGAPEVRRHLRCTDGDLEVDVAWVPRLDYAREDTRVERTAGGFVARRGEDALGLSGLPEGEVREVEGGPGVVGRLGLRSGDDRVVLTRWGDPDPDADPDRARAELDHAVRGWRSWVQRPEVGERSWAGPWKSQVIRSELFLGLMTQPGSGALAAAPTASLPETLGGVRNWDYRYAWIRDAAQIAQVFFAVGHPGHVEAFVRWAERAAEEGERPTGALVPILHPLRPGVGLQETTLDHLEGYRGSRPVRIGNAAADQLQLDVYGELLNVVFERTRLGGEFLPEAASFLRRLADAACGKWRLPDFGIWEMRNGPFHQVYSKLMVWTALHRAVWLGERGYIEGDPGRWRAAMGEIRREILRFGYDEGLGSFVQRYGRRDLDAANLLVPMMEFLPASDPRVQGTLDRTLERLTVEDLVYRYRAEDGLPGEEGCFVLCTCWLVDALALSGRMDEAQRIFESLMDRTNHLGLLAEQIDPYSGEFLGNFPQAYSHLGMINSTLYLADREGRELPIGPLLGMSEEDNG